jgi:hypothetical protein
MANFFQSGLKESAEVVYIHKDEDSDEVLEDVVFEANNSELAHFLAKEVGNEEHIDLRVRKKHYADEDELNESLNVLNESISDIKETEVYYEPSSESLIEIGKISDDLVSYIVYPGDGTASFTDKGPIDYLLNELNKYGYELLKYKLVDSEFASSIFETGEDGKFTPIGKFIIIKDHNGV